MIGEAIFVHRKKTKTNPITFGVTIGGFIVEEPFALLDGGPKR